MAGDPFKYFRVEARELLEQLVKGVMELERDRPPAEVVPRLLRFAHTLKGAARVVRQPEIAELAHGIEDRLAPFREEAGPLPREGLAGALGLLDTIAARVGALAPPVEATPAGAPPPVEEPFRVLRADVAEVDGLLEGIAETQACLGSLRRALAPLGRARRLAGLVAEPAAARRGREGAARDLRALLTDLERGLGGAAERVEQELQQVRGAAERLRLLPASTLFGPLERTAHDAAQATGRRVSFRGRGGEIRLDGNVLAALQPALVQAVRNAVAHGIEDEAERAAAGKALEGAVVLEVARRGDRVAFVCRDDGRGIDLEGVRRALARKGLVPDEARGSDPQDLLRRLLEGGISTSAGVTEVSGRGVGLDVVREAAARLGGRAAVRTVPAQGTTLELVVPVSLSSLDALVVEAAGTTAALPLDAVRRTLRVDAAGAGKRGTIDFEGRIVPFLPLARLLSAGDPGGERRRAWSAVVVAGGDGLAALGVDRLLGAAPLLVRPLPPQAPADPIVGGASFDGEGNPRLLLSPEGLVAAARRAGGPAPPARPAPPPILVVDDSLTTRMLEQSILESAGYAVELASSGEEALEKVRRRRFSLLLVDVEMPGMDGYALLDQLRADPALRDLPAILVTSRTAPEDRDRGARAGARAFIVKSAFDQGELLERIRGLVG